VLAACLAILATGLTGIPTAQAKNGDTHITGQGITQTIDCNESTLYVYGTSNTITAKGTCWGVAIQGSSNIVIADNVIHDITVYGWDQTAFYHDGDPAVIDFGPQLGVPGMLNRIQRVPA
jgi:Protein of unknown function (DUF3060)